MRANALNRRSDYKTNKLTSKQLFTKKNETLKLTKFSKNLKKIIKEHHEFRNHEHSKIQRTYEKIMRKVKIIKKEVVSVLKKCTTCITIKKSRKTSEKNSIAIETSKQF